MTATFGFIGDHAAEAQTLAETLIADVRGDLYENDEPLEAVIASLLAYVVKAQYPDAGALDDDVEQRLRYALMVGRTSYWR